MIKRIGNYEVEFPTTCNGNQTTCMGFITPSGNARYQNSQFFMVFGKYVTYDNPWAVTDRVKRYCDSLLER